MYRDSPLIHRAAEHIACAMPYILDRLREPSTWRGLAITLTGLGLAIAPERWQAISSIGLTLAGLIGVSTPDQLAPTVPDETPQGTETDRARTDPQT